MNKEKAQKLVEVELASDKHSDDAIDVVVLEESTLEKSWGWVFFYQSRQYVETGDFRYSLGGNAPIIVNRDTGQLEYTGTAYPLDHYLSEYEAKLPSNT